MIAKLKPHLEVRDSGVAWLGDIPAHWRVQRLKTLLRERDERSSTGDEQLLRVSQYTGVTERRAADGSNEIDSRAASLVGYKKAAVDDLIVNIMLAWNGSLGISRYSGIVSPAYGVYRFTSPHEPWFLHHLLRTDLYKTRIKTSSKGVVESRLRLYTDDLFRIETLVPPLEEQVAVVRFLDRADRRIRRSIAAKQKMIHLLEEQEATIVHEAVTRGLNPDTPMKPSGIEWLGDIPAHWQVTRVKDEFQNLNTRRVPLSATERGEMTSRAFDYYGASGVIDRVDDFLFDGDLLLIAEDGANLVLRNLPLAIVARGKFWVNNHAHILRPKRGDLEYLASYMEGLDYRPWITGAAQPKLTQDRLMSIKIAVAPSEEQRAIIGAVKQHTSGLRVAASLARREVKLLQEYRARLISDVVTGKLDVRVAGFDLAEEPELVDLIEDQEELEEGSEFDDLEADEELT